MVFIVDDDSFLHFIMKKTIKKINDSVAIEVFSNGRTALDAFEKIVAINGELPSVVFLDINMPILDGWQVLDALMKLKPDIAESVDIYLCSTSLDPNDKKKAEQYPIVKEFLVKIVANETLERIISPLQK